MSSTNVTVIGNAAYISTRVEHGETVETLRLSTEQNKKKTGFSIIIINGTERSGKSVLAKVLTSKGHSHTHFEGRNFKVNQFSDDYWNKVSRMSGNYVLDDAHEADDDELKALLLRVKAGGGSIIILTRSGLNLDLRDSVAKYSLTHSGLIEIKYSRVVSL
ncbi:MAG: hypothetical protein EOO52_13725 [Gammaproteobacteria bacterium]|nr:MAG: hypothetical protein EOO52_13725 [Gammaproteobacteria bacterium]